MLRFQKESKGSQLQDPWNNCNRKGDSRAKDECAWIDVILEKRMPHKVILELVGKKTQDRIFQRAVSESKVSALIVPNPAEVELENAVTLGAARLTKDKLESYGMNCIEDDECVKIRRKANELAGSSGFTDRGHDFALTELGGQKPFRP